MTETTILDDRAVSEIEDRANAATRGPWHTAKRRPALVIAEDRARVADCHVGIGMAVDEAQFNSEFIAHAREDIPALIATVKHLRAQLGILRQRVEDTVLVARTDEGADGFISAYHFQAGAIHRLLAEARKGD